MGVLGRREILKRIEQYPPSDPKALVVAPLRKEAASDHDSIDLRLGSRFLIPYPYRAEAVQYGKSTKVAEHQRLIDVPRGGHIIVPAHSTVLGAVFEYMKLPYDVAGQVLTRSSVARLFIGVATAPWVHPLYRGCLTLEIANASGTSIKLEPRKPIGQLVLFSVDGAEPPERGDQIEGTYIGPVGPELTGSHRLEEDEGAEGGESHASS